MDRRTFLKGVGALPAALALPVSLPDVSPVVVNEPWELSMESVAVRGDRDSAWFDCGLLRIRSQAGLLEPGDVVHVHGRGQLMATGVVLSVAGPMEDGFFELGIRLRPLEPEFNEARVVFK